MNDTPPPLPPQGAHDALLAKFHERGDEIAALRAQLAALRAAGTHNPDLVIINVLFCALCCDLSLTHSGNVPLSHRRAN